MRKKLLVVTALFLFGALSLSARPINIFGGAGIAFSDVEGLFFDVGAEMKLSSNFWAQILFDYYLNPTGLDIPGVDDSMYGINLYGVYKYKMTNQMNLFAKAGAHVTTLRASAQVMGITVAVTDTNFGLGAGAGIEIKVGSNMFVLAGGTIKFLFAEGDTATWFKLYGGFGFQVGK